MTCVMAYFCAATIASISMDMLSFSDSYLMLVFILICFRVQVLTRNKQTQKFVFINYSGSPGLQEYHGKAVALDVKDPHVPIPSLFIIHEMRVRGFHPFAPLNPSIPNDTLWQNWIESDGVYDPVSHSFKRDGPPMPADNGHSSITALPQFPTATTNTGGASSNKHSVLPLNADVIADILAATRAMPSWKACEEEGTTTWTGTAEENIHKYTE
jgi:hypothetical protein